MKILLDYLFPIVAIEPTPAASTAFLKQVCVVAKPKSGQEGNVGQIFLCTSKEAVAVRTDNTNSDKLFDAGMTRVFILLASDLEIASALDENQGEFYTVLISDDFDKDDIAEGVTTAGVKASLHFQDITIRAKSTGVAGNSITIEFIDDVIAGSEVCSVSGTDVKVFIQTGVSTAQQVADALNAESDFTDIATVEIDEDDESDAQIEAGPTPLAGGVTKVTDGEGLHLGTFDGVCGVSSDDDEFLAEQAAMSKRCAFHTTDSNGGKNLFYAFGKLLSNPLNWKNQQYIPMTIGDDVETLGDANTLFDARISFVISDDEFSTRLAMFCAGGRAIVAPYIERNLQIDMQSKALGYIADNQPGYTKTQAALLEDELQKVIQSYIERVWIEAGTVEVSLLEDNFVASGAINISEPKALWRIFGEMRETL